MQRSVTSRRRVLDELKNPPIENLALSSLPIFDVLASFRQHMDWPLLVLCRKSNRAISSSRYSKKGSPYSITECRVPELMPVLGSQPAGDVSHKPGGRLTLLQIF